MTFLSPVSASLRTITRRPTWLLPRSPLQQSRSLAYSSTPPVPSPAEPSSSSPETHSTNLSLSAQVRLLMRRVPYPVAIITAADPTPMSSSINSSSSSSNNNNNNRKDNPFARARGMTVSSFNTVTLIPDPVISFNVKRPSETLFALQASGHFLAHLLAPNRDTAALAREFSRGNQNLGALGSGESVFGFEFVPPCKSDADGAWQGSASELESRIAGGLPVLRRRTREKRSSVAQIPEKETGRKPARDFPFIFECRVHDQQVEVFDHTIVFGTVVRTLAGDPGLFVDLGETLGEVGDLCLTYADTRFWTVGREV